MPRATGDADAPDPPEPAPSDPRIPEELRGELVALRDPPRAALLRASFVEEFRRLDLLRAAEPGWRPPAGARAAEAGEADADAAAAPAEAGAAPDDAGERPGEADADDRDGATGDRDGATGDRDEPGRGPLHVVSLAGGGQAVVRPFRRGGLVRRLVEARYLLGDRAFEEMILLERLRRRELPVPRPLAAVQSRRLPGYRAALVTRRIPGVAPLSRLLAGASTEEAERLMEAAGRTVARLHAAGGRHADLNAHNLLADPARPDRPVYLVDLDRGRLGPAPLPVGPARGNLRRLRRSLEKLGLAEGLDHWGGLVSAYRRNREGTAGGSAG